ncbi:hypothetical protein BALCAV_0202965 [Alkalihalobacillus alcalophilus ATCC 27647 = CGMCC 1.3604]|uniref:Uncharacterized protein n=1 Tax=Alkalihalobacillus alcalophilus ATCC 27647 = CGMCC 1.3604 TaxID=1218173 RepID=A0A094WRU6_ALKAL|nr:hypothetical protein BALCAV_0202965 [Alkalihalobacillus alcalophilus ATCC 27647 = CGMCC 1.3604]
MVLGATAEALHFSEQFPSTAYEEMCSDCQRLNRSCKVNLSMVSPSNQSLSTVKGQSYAAKVESIRWQRKSECR